MKRTLHFYLSLSICLLLTLISKAQTSTNTVNYQVTYDVPTASYTAWVIPNYTLPNGASELGATAQFTLVVPKDFVITSLTDIHGTWDKPSNSTFLKLGPGQPNQSWPSSLPQTLNYYVIGKVNSESSYGPFQVGVPVALFSFKGNGCYGVINPLPLNDPFILAANTTYRLNVANSFYSRSSQPAGGNQDPLEQFAGITGSPASCSSTTINAVSDASSTSLNKSVLVNILGNDTKNGGAISPASVTVTLLTNPKHGGASIINGVLTYTPTKDYSGKDTLQYQVCEGSICATAYVYLTTIGSSDLSISKSVDKTSAVVGDFLTYTLTVKNSGLAATSNVVILDTLTSSVVYQSSNSTKGSYSLATKKWTIPSLAVNETAILSIIVKVVTQGVTQNYASIVSSDVTDSTTTNNQASACTTVPMNMCSDEQLDISIPAVYTNVQWYKDGVSFAKGNAIVVTASGSYTYTATNASCPVNGCCPIVVVVNDCCKPNVCVPYSVKKTKSAKK